MPQESKHDLALPENVPPHPGKDRPCPEEAAADLLRRGLAALEAGDIARADNLFEAALYEAPTALALSCRGYCLACLEGELSLAFALCSEALRREPGNPLHHLHLGRIYLLAGDKRHAVRAFRNGLSFAYHPRLVEAIEALGMRRPLPFPALARGNPLNVTCGFLFHRLGLRSLLHHPERYRRHHH